MPIITYTFSEQEVDQIRDLMEQMDIELGSVMNDLVDEKTLRKAGRLSSLQRRLHQALFQED